MAKNRISLAIRGLEEEAKRLEKSRLAYQCECPHHVKPDYPEVVDIGKANEHIYKCKLCKDIITISNISPEKRQEAIDTVVAMINIIKIKCNLEREDDEKMLKKMAKLELRLRDDLPKAYEAVTRDRKNKRRNRSNNNGSQSSWTARTLR